MKKIVILQPCWERPRITRIVTKQLDKFCDKLKDYLNITVIYVLSEEDKYFKSLLKVYEEAKHGKRLVIHPNTNLGEKFNAGVEEANKIKYDYLMGLGSDNLICCNLIDVYKPYLDRSEPFFGINGVYFYKDLDNIIFFEYKNHPYAIGPGRMIRRDVVKKVISKYGFLYTPDKQRAMDADSAKKIMSLGYTQKIINVGRYPYIVDIKSDTNINSFDRILLNNNGTNVLEFVDKSVLTGVYPVLEKI